MKRPLVIATVALLAAVGAGSAVVLAGGLPSPDPVPTPTIVPLVQESAPEPTATSTTPDPVGETATPTPTPTPSPSETADADVVVAQRALADQGYYIGPIDGEAGPATASAVQAFQKVNGLGPDGVIGPNTLAALADPVVPTLRNPSGNRIEVDLDKQVLYVVEGGRIARILPVSSGSGESYAQAGGGTARSVTPVGTFTVQRHIRGERHAPLGTLYDPMYFYGGWAIHGSNSVPGYPASHGCVRVTRSDATWLFDRVPIGMTVDIYGSRNAFSPSRGESAGTDAPAGDTAGTTPDDGIQTEEPTPAPTQPSSPTTPPEAPAPPAPQEPGTEQPTPTPTPAPAPEPDPSSGSASPGADESATNQPTSGQAAPPEPS